MATFTLLVACLGLLAKAQDVVIINVTSVAGLPPAPTDVWTKGPPEGFPTFPGSDTVSLETTIQPTTVIGGRRVPLTISRPVDVAQPTLLEPTQSALDNAATQAAVAKRMEDDAKAYNAKRELEARQITRVPKTISREAKTISRPASSTTTSTTTSSSTRSSTTSSSTRSSTTSSSTRSSTTSTTTTSSTRSSTTSSSTSTSSTISYCSASYFAPSTVTGTGTLPKPTTFVRRSGTKLTVDGKTWIPVGPNVYWLGADENVQPFAYTSKTRIREAMAQAVAMGANMIRSHTLGVSLGNALALEPSFNVFNQRAFDTIDYSIYAAREYGLRLVIPLNDNYDYYHGGKYTFLRWRGYNSNTWGYGGNKFYTDNDIINDHRVYVQQIVTHTNQYTGVKLANDPTIFAWELGNEYGAYMGREGYPPFGFQDGLAQWIKQQGAQQLIMAGDDGFYNWSTKATAPSLQSGNIDIMTDHLYPLANDIMPTEINLANNANKNLYIGEYDWTGLHGGKINLAQFISLLEQSNGPYQYVGDSIWSLFGHDDTCCSWVTHNDGYSLYYPNGNPSSLQTNILAVTQHWYRRTGRVAPSYLPAVKCPQPMIYPSTWTGLRT